MNRARVQSGLERLLTGDGKLVRGRRVGLIANPTTVDSGLRHAANLLWADSRFDLAALFGPEHGIRGDAQYMVAVDEERDAETGVPVYSLYGSNIASLTPKPHELDGLDALIFDIQDVGSRYYTYVWTMVFAMRACAGRDIRFVVLDRPNPLGGIEVEGGLIDDGYDSFVGVCSVPNRHGLTAGEIARMVVEREGLDVDLEVVAMDGWRRGMAYSETGLPWVMPSPNMPTPDTALVYPGMCLLEGTMLSEGRGTTRPFELAGAPHLSGQELARELDRQGVPGAVFRPASFIPTWDKHSGECCHGVQIHVTDAAAFAPYRCGVAFLVAARRQDPDAFSWRSEAYEFVDDIPAIDLLAGNAALRRGIEDGADTDDICQLLVEGARRFRSERQAWLLYEA